MYDWVSVSAWRSKWYGIESFCCSNMVLSHISAMTAAHVGYVTKLVQQYGVKGMP